VTVVVEVVKTSCMSSSRAETRAETLVAFVQFELFVSLQKKVVLVLEVVLVIVEVVLVVVLFTTTTATAVSSM
jgi:hypothetical protein